MFNSISRLKSCEVYASDGQIGPVNDVFFDDRGWAIRYLVVDTGSWLSGRRVLISPHSVHQPKFDHGSIELSLTQKQVRFSPDVDTHQPVSRQHELEFLRYYDYPPYWEGGDLWGLGGLPYEPLSKVTEGAREANDAMLKRDFQPADVHLRSSEHVSGYEILATDGSVGEVKDFVFDEQSWAIRYMVVDTHRWWPGGRKVLIGISWADQIDWATKMVKVRLTREQVKSSPEFEGVGSIERDFELRLHDNYQRQPYWL